MINFWYRFFKVCPYRLFRGYLLRGFQRWVYFVYLVSLEVLIELRYGWLFDDYLDTVQEDEVGDGFEVEILCWEWELNKFYFVGLWTVHHGQYGRVVFVIVHVVNEIFPLLPEVFIKPFHIQQIIWYGLFEMLVQPHNELKVLLWRFSYQ